MPDPNKAKNVPTDGPAFSHKQAAAYISVSERHIYALEEMGELFFFPIGPKLKRTTKPLCDDLLNRAIKEKLAKLEGRGE